MLSFIPGSEAANYLRTITVEEAGSILGLKRTAAYDAVRRGEIPALRLGRRIRVPVPALIRLLETCGTADPDFQTDGEDASEQDPMQPRQLRPGGATDD